MKLTDDRGVKVIRKDKTSSTGKDYTTYSLMISQKQNEEWVAAFLDCTFKKGVSVNNKAKIKIINAFPTLNKYNDKVSIRWMITDFEVIEEGEIPPQTEPSGVPSFMEMPEGLDNFPFE